MCFCCERACNHCLDALCDSCCFAIGIAFKSIPALPLICYEVCQEENYDKLISSDSDNQEIYKRCWTYTAFIMMIGLFILFSFSILLQWTLLYYLIFPMIFIITINLVRCIYSTNKVKGQDRKKEEIIQYSQKNENYAVNNELNQDSKFPQNIEQKKYRKSITQQEILKNWVKIYISFYKAVSQYNSLKQEIFMQILSENIILFSQVKCNKVNSQ